MIYVITGVRGAGKTTLISNIDRTGLGIVLQPSTSRPRRFEGEAEYDFVTEWIKEKYAWTIDVGQHKYGMRVSEIEKSKEAFAFTVFEPINIATFYAYRQANFLSSLTIGLDTVSDISEQHRRVGMMPSRMMSADQFGAALSKVREADVVIRGSEQEVLAKISKMVAERKISG